VQTDSETTPAPVEEIVGRKRAFSRKRYTPPDEVNLGRLVSIGIDAKHAAELKAALIPTPVGIEAPRIGIDLDGSAVPGAGFQDFLDINLAFRSCAFADNALALVQDIAACRHARGNGTANSLGAPDRCRIVWL
jgi:hypothetical protein